MKKISIIVIFCLTFFGNCQQEIFYDYEDILRGLELNTTLFYDEMKEDRDIYFDCYSLTEEEHHKLADIYNRTVSPNSSHRMFFACFFES